MMYPMGTASVQMLVAKRLSELNKEIAGLQAELDGYVPNKADIDRAWYIASLYKKDVVFRKRCRTSLYQSLMPKGYVLPMVNLLIFPVKPVKLFTPDKGLTLLLETLRGKRVLLNELQSKLPESGKVILNEEEYSLLCQK